MTTTFPACTPREACVAALAILSYGGVLDDACWVLHNNGVKCELNVEHHKARVKLGRSWHEAQAGCNGDALRAALWEALGGQDE